jgi:hypothetical protein
MYIPKKQKKCQTYFCELPRYVAPWRHGIVVIASAYMTEDPGFESRQGVRFLECLTLQ